MITVTYKAQNYKNQREGARMVRASSAAIGGKPVSYAWLIRDALDLRYDIQQGRCDAEDLPDAVREAAEALAGQAFDYVDWPR